MNHRGRKHIGIVLLVAGITAAGTFGWLAINKWFPSPLDRCDLHFSNGETVINVPIAISTREQTSGLSGRHSAGNGMLFTWERPGVKSFWMRDTLFALDIAYFDVNGILLSIDRMEPNTDASHESGGEVSYALELKAGEFYKRGITPGAKMFVECKS